MSAMILSPHERLQMRQASDIDRAAYYPSWMECPSGQRTSSNLQIFQLRWGTNFSEGTEIGKTALTFMHLKDLEGF